MRPETRGLALVVVSAVSFGGVAVLGKDALASGMGVATVLFWRWLVAALALLPFALRRPLPSRAGVGAFALGALGYAGTSGVYFLALPHLPAAVASFLLFLSPVFVALLAAGLLRERLHRWGMAALAASVAGLALLAFAPGARLPLVGVLLGLGSAVAYSFTVVAGRRLTGEADPVSVAAHAAAGAAFAFALIGLATGALTPPPTAGAWAGLVALGVVSTALSVATFCMALPLIGAPRAALVSTLEPVSTVLLARVFLGEVLLPVQLAGAALILVAVVLVARDR